MDVAITLACLPSLGLASLICLQCSRRWVVGGGEDSTAAGGAQAVPGSSITTNHAARQLALHRPHALSHRLEHRLRLGLAKEEQAELLVGAVL